MRHKWCVEHFIHIDWALYRNMHYISDALILRNQYCHNYIFHRSRSLHWSASVSVVRHWSNVHEVSSPWPSYEHWSWSAWHLMTGSSRSCQRQHLSHRYNPMHLYSLPHLTCSKFMYKTAKMWEILSGRMIGI